MANTDSAGSPKPPPHLRVSENEDRECDTCTHYLKGGCPAPFTGRCHKWSDECVSGEWVCDSWEKGANQDPDQDDEDEAGDTPQDDQPKSLREAAREVRVRAHYRRRTAS